MTKTDKQYLSLPEAAKQVERRKEEHLRIPLTENVGYKKKTALFEDVFLVHNALPELNREAINTSTVFLGHKLKAPLMISAMTGGAKKAEEINKNLAAICQKLGVCMGLGSMKAMIVNPELNYSYKIRDVAPDIFLAGNIGANDLSCFPPEVLKEVLKRVGAGILAVHLNSGQELVQKEGKARYERVLELITRYSEKLPVYVKETGQGISYEVAKKLSGAGILAIDVAGSGGTSWTGVEYLRQGGKSGPYWDWGIPTALSIIETRRATGLPIIAGGGIRTGEEIVKAIILGADIGAAALPFLKAAAKSREAVYLELSRFVREIGDVMFLLGAKDILSLKNQKPIITGKLKELSTALEESRKKAT